jgi:hypothetical protein
MTGLRFPMVGCLWIQMFHHGISMVGTGASGIKMPSRVRLKLLLLESEPKTENLLLPAPASVDSAVSTGIHEEIVGK